MSVKKVVVGMLAAIAVLSATAVPSFAGGGWYGGWYGGYGWRRPVYFGPRFVFGAPYVVAPPVYYYPRPYVYAPPAPVVVAPPAPPVYVQSQQYWYYCYDPAGYYPTVAQCPGGWTQVSPQSEASAPQQ
jgi:hypothetical protein